jgi:GT2 family glycosyltransferase/glycosyltransferase involved in cell wall biosynthesis
MLLAADVHKKRHLHPLNQSSQGLIINNQIGTLKRLKVVRISSIPQLIRGYSLLSLLLVEKGLAHLLGGKKLYQKHLRFLVSKTQLFDSGYYLEINSDVFERHVNPLNHYVAHGDKENRCPMPFFDPSYYRSQISLYSEHINSLLHYSYIGRYLNVSPSPWFDLPYYLKENKDVLRSGIEPMLHYLKWGGAEGRSPTPQFDGSYYLRNNPDVAEVRGNPLLHYLRVGRFEGRPTALYQPSLVEQAQKNSEPLNLHNLHLVAQRQAVSHAKIDVIVPVYKDQELTLRTIHSVLVAQVNLCFELIVINDCSPEPELVAALENLHHKKLITLLHNTENRGFVYTVNRGIQLHPERDVVLLNADTEVFAQWLDRLHETAHRQTTTGTVTPLSNNATICSYPRFLEDNPYLLELGYEELDQLASSVNQNIEVEAPTGVGFCMYIRRDCLTAVGLFDEETFGTGYGEENDFCQRVIIKGWHNIIAANTFVRHWGAASFQNEKAERVNAAMKALDFLHPDYRFQVSDFIRQDPLAQAREQLDWARLLKHVKTRNILIVGHNRGGGCERHIQEDTERLLQDGIGVFYLRPVPRNPSQVRLSHPKCSQLFNLKSYDLADIDTLALVLTELGIKRIHTHSLVDFSINATENILKLVKRLKSEFWVDLHDYTVICPRINLTNRIGRYCGEPNEDACNRCCEVEPNDFGVTNIKEWRQMNHQALQQADKIWVPSVDMEKRIQRYFRDISLSLSPHEEFDPQNLAITTPQLTANSTLRIVVIGAIGRVKGFDVLNACAADAKKRKLPLEFVVLGYSLKDADLEKNGVKITGRYLEIEAMAKLKELEPHVVWLPSTWPETYSYTLSLALTGGYPTFAFDIGAIAERLRLVGQEQTLIPFELLDFPQMINDRFVSYLKNSQKQKNISQEVILESQIFSQAS